MGQAIDQVIGSPPIDITVHGGAAAGYQDASAALKLLLDRRANREAVTTLMF